MIRLCTGPWLHMYVVRSTGGEDYDAVSVELVFNATVSRSCAEIPIADDPLVEPPETFNITITGDPPVIIDPPTSIVTIVDNDSKLTVAIHVYCG